MRTPFRVLLTFVLLTVPVTATAQVEDASGNEHEGAHAASVTSSEGDLIGAFRENGTAITGRFVSAEWDAATGLLSHVRVRGIDFFTRVVTNLTGVSATLDGAVARVHDEAGTLSLHDNPWGWLTVRSARGNVTFVPHPGVDVEQPQERELHLHAGSVTLSARLHEGARWVVDAEGVTAVAGDGDRLAVTLLVDDGVVPPAHASAEWLLIARSGSAVATDVLRWNTPTPVALERVDAGHLRVRVPSEDVLFVRADTSGVLPPDDAGKYVVHKGLDYPRNAPSERVLEPGERALAFNVTATDAHGTRVLLRSAGAGVVDVRHDVVPPVLLERTTRNLTERWDPLNLVPLLVTRTDEPVLARLTVPIGNGGTYERPTVQPALEQRFRLGGLKADTEYAFTLTLTDLAGNEVVHEGAFTTPPVRAPEPPDVRILEPAADAVVPGPSVTIRARLASAGEAVEWPEGRYAVFVDKKPVTTLAVLDGTSLVVHTPRLEPGEHDVVVELATPDGERTLARHAFSVQARADVPVLPVLIVALVLGMTGAVTRVRARPAAERARWTRR